jgi:ATP-binding cassette subfamily B protein
MHLLLGWAPRFKKNLIPGIIFKSIEAIFMGAPYGIVFLLLNDLLEDTFTLQDAMIYTLSIGGCFVIQLVASYWFAKMVWPLANDMVKEIRIKIGDHLRTLSMSYFDKKRTGSLNTLAVDEMQFVQIVMYQAFPDYIVAVTFAILGPFVLLLCDWKMGVASIAAIPAALYFLSRYNTASSDALTVRSAALAKLNAELIEYIQGMEVSRVYGRLGMQFNRTRMAVDDFRKTNIDCEVKAITPIGLCKLSLDMGIMMISAAGLSLYIGATLEPVLFLFFLIFSLRVYEPIRLLIPAYGYCNLAKPAVEQINLLLQTKPLPISRKVSVSDRFNVGISDVTFAYEKTPVLRDVSFEIPEKSMTAIVGPSGSGKTTLTSLIARFRDVDSGRITIGGIDIRDIHPDTLNGLIRMVFQNVYLFDATISENIAIGAGSRKVDDKEIIAAAQNAGCHEFITALPYGYHTVIGEDGAALSGGERQRISIARAMLKDAPIIILDEATASVDPENEWLIQQAIDKLVASKTLIVIAHRLNTIANADQIIVLDRSGTVAQSGRHETLLAGKGPYRQIWENRIHAGKWFIDDKGWE